MIFGTSKHLFVKNSWFKEKRRPETCTVEFVESKKVTVGQAFFSLLASVIDVRDEPASRYLKAHFSVNWTVTKIKS